MDARTGKAIRLGRIFNPSTGRALVVAASHGIMSGAPMGLRTVAEADATLPKLRAADAVMVSPGMLRRAEPLFVGRGAPALIVHLDWKNHGRAIYPPRTQSRLEGVLAQVASMDSVAAAGADAVMTYLYLGHRDTGLERAEIERNAHILDGARRLGLGVIIEPRSAQEGAEADATSPAVMSLYTRISSELGADAIKVIWPGSAEGLAEVTAASLCPVLLAGGPGGDDDESTLQLAATAVGAGAAGLMVGRRVLSAADPDALLHSLRHVVHGE